MKSKGTAKMLHPSSRKAKKLISQTHHVSKINKRKKLRNCKDELKRLKLAWFKDNIPKDATSLSVPEIKQLMAKYLRRFKAETKAEQREVEHCSVSMSIDMSNALVDQEMREYKTAGLSIPDLTSKVHLEKLRNWNGEVAQMAAIPMTVVKDIDNKK
uniref:Translation machinery-associated protein 16 n=2 Tax=Schistocephalus solidus TaxID=70667 RepID=A0A0X3NVF5_SCHSO